MTLIEGVPSAHVEREWSEVEHLIGLALAECGAWYTAEAVKAAAMSGDMQLWRIVSGESVLAAGLTEIRVYPARKVAWLFALAGGEMKTWFHHLPTIEAWARSMGCDSLAVNGRRGWVRVLPDWSELSVVLEKGL